MKTRRRREKDFSPAGRPLSNYVRRVERRDARTPPGDPAEHVCHLRVGRPGEVVRYDFQKPAGQYVPVVVYVGLDHCAGHAADVVRGVVLVERELDVPLAELYLLVAARRALVEHLEAQRRLERVLSDGELDLVNEPLVAVREEAILLDGISVPAEALQVVERGAVGQVDGRHGGREVQETGEGRRLRVGEVGVALFGVSDARALRQNLDQLLVRLRELPPLGVGEVEAGLLRQEHQVYDLRRLRRNVY